MILFISIVPGLKLKKYLSYILDVVEETKQLIFF